MKLTAEEITQDKIVDKTEVQAKRQQEYKLIGSIVHMPGLTLFEWNVLMGEIKKCEVQHQVIVGIDGKVINKHKATQQKDCHYFEALNMKNAQRKVRNIIKKFNDEHNNRRQLHFS